jgi:hypothetical protein
MADLTYEPETLPGSGHLAGEIIAAGAVAGVIGGVLMAVWGAFATAVKGLGWLAIPQMIGATFMKPEAMLHPVALIVWGTVLHLLVSVVWGVLFASLVRRETPNSAAVLAGLAYAVGIFLLMAFVVVPVTNQVMADRTPMLLGNLFIMHLLFGVAVGLAPTLRRQFSPHGDGHRHEGQHEEDEAHGADHLPAA